MDALLETRRSFKGDLQVKRDEEKAAAEEIEKLEAKVSNAVAGLEERDRLVTKVQGLKAERDRLLEERKRLEEDLPRLLEVAGDNGFNEAREHYKQQVEGRSKKPLRRES